MFKGKQSGTLLTIISFILTAGCSGSAGGVQPFSPYSSSQHVSDSSGSTSAGLHQPIAGSQQLAHSTSYTITDLGTLGGTFSIAVQLNNSGFVTGFSNLPGDTAAHAFLWRKGLVTDLGTLGGPSSGACCPANEKGEVAIFAETSKPDPLGGEGFCFDIGFPSSMTCLPFVWRNGVKTVLPTLGGYNAAAGWINNRGQVAGVAENTTPNRTCGPTENLQSKPVVWQLGQPVRIREIPTWPGDAEGIAVAINDHDQIAAASGPCQLPRLHAYFVQDGMLTNMGSLGGTTNTDPQAINDKGEVVGFSNVRGDRFPHAFFWQRGRVMADLGTLQGDVASAAYGVNEDTQIVGESDDANGNPRPYIWQNNVMTDLNTLIPATSPLYLLVATGINDAGEIAGFGLQTTTGEIHPFLATPSNSSIQGRARMGRPRLSPALREFLRAFGHSRMKFLTHR